MASCQPVKFANVSRLKYQAIRARIRAQASSLTIDGDSGTASGSTPLGKVAFSWSYDEAGQTLTVQCTSKPMLVSEATVAAKLRDLMESVTT
jgi:hypothetical protein